MIPSFPKVVPRRVIALAVLIVIALVAGFILSSQYSHNPNVIYTPIFATTPTPR
ncbi:MAG TPA: hypothetical protein VF813_11800 [Anaerolineaceae bacterium]